jgi:hypothetical protein
MGQKGGGLRQAASGMLLIAAGEALALAGAAAYAGFAVFDPVRARDGGDYRWVSVPLIAANLLVIGGKTRCLSLPAKMRLFPACLWASLGCDAACVGLNLAAEFTPLPGSAAALILALSFAGNLAFVGVLVSASELVKDAKLCHLAVELGLFWIIFGALTVLSFATGYWDMKGVVVLVVGAFVTYVHYFALLLKARRAVLALDASGSVGRPAADPDVN